MEEEYSFAWHNRETFAHFGRTYYSANVFETGLALTILQADFLYQKMEEIKRNGLKDFDRAKYEHEFDEFMDKQHRLTLGQLVKRLLDFNWVTDELKRDLSKAISKRNYLAHHFFRDKAEDILTRSGRDKMIEELSADHDFFEEMDKKVDEIVKPMRKSLGLSEEKIEKICNELMAKHKDAFS